jgi:hypothetical protein
MFKLDEQNNKDIARLTFSIQELELLDAILESANNKIICKAPIKFNPRNDQSFLYIQIEIFQKIFEDQKTSIKNLEFQVHIKQHPIRIYLNGKNLNFLINFLQKEEFADIDILFNEFFFFFFS